MKPKALIGDSLTNFSEVGSLITKGAYIGFEVGRCSFNRAQSAHAKTYYLCTCASYTWDW